MKILKLAVLGSLLTLGLAISPNSQAGDLSNATLDCYVDTSAYDQWSSGFCASVWTPGQPDPTYAVFEVHGLPTGNYSYSWSSASCSGIGCHTLIGVEQMISRSVTVTDNDTGATKTLSARANYIDGWH